MNGPVLDAKNRKEYIFVCMDDIIRSTKVPMLLKGLKEYQEQFPELNMSKIADMDEKNLLRFVLTSQYENPIQEFFTPEMLEADIIASDEGEQPLSEVLRDLWMDDLELFHKAPSGQIASAIAILLEQKFVERVYFYTKDYDVRAIADISNLFGKHEEKCFYVYGDMRTVIQTFPDKPTAYYFNHIEYLYQLFSMDKSFYEYTEVSLADVGYNYIFDDLNMELTLQLPYTEEDFLTRVVKFGLFSPFIMDDSYFTSNDYVEHLGEVFTNALKEAETPEEKDAILQMLKAQSNDIENVRQHGDTKMFQDMDGELIAPGVNPDDPHTKPTDINKL